MIEPYLQQQGKEIMMNVLSAEIAKEGETIELVIPINEDEVLNYCQSGNSFITTKQGLLTLLTKKETQKRLNQYYKQHEYTKPALNKIETILQNQTENQPELQTHNDQHNQNQKENAPKQPAQPQNPQ